MKKSLVFSFLLTALLVGLSYAEDAEDAAAPAQDVPVEAPAAPVETAPDTASVVAEPAAEPQDATLVDNLEFISGEVSELNEAGKEVSVRLYGESEDATSDKVLKVALDENTDITDGEQDRDLKSLTVGTEVDVEYDPATNKATYIFVY